MDPPFDTDASRMRALDCPGEIAITGRHCHVEALGEERLNCGAGQSWRVPKEWDRSEPHYARRRPEPLAGPGPPSSGRDVGLTPCRWVKAGACEYKDGGHGSKMAAP